MWVWRNVYVSACVSVYKCIYMCEYVCMSMWGDMCGHLWMCVLCMNVGECTYICEHVYLCVCRSGNLNVSMNGSVFIGMYYIVENVTLYV